MSSYPSRTKKNYAIAQLNLDPLLEEIWLAGRVIGILDDGFVLQDESGRIDILMDGAVNVGDIMEVRIIKEEGVDARGRKLILFKGQALKILAPCTADFFIRKEDPNYLKMVVDLNLKERMLQRTVIFQKIREFFAMEGFIEADTPSLVRLPGMEPYLDVFKTRFFNDPEKKNPPEDMYLVTSPEYALKKLLVAGFEKVYQLAKSFRNKETNSNTHNPEFTLLEWYRAYASYLDIMEDVEKLVRTLVRGIAGKEAFSYQGKIIEVGQPWERLRVKDAFLKYADIAAGDFENPENLRKVAQKKGYRLNDQSSFDDAFFIIFMNEIEPKLGLEKPTILYEYPVSMASLSKVCEDNPWYAERFEIYIAGMELGNAFSELNDPSEQQRRLELERKERQKLQKDEYPIDENFLKALRFGMPPAGGIALGVDRLIMLLTDTPDIRNVLFFPQRDL